MKLKATMPVGGGLKDATNAGGEKELGITGRGPGADPKMPSTEIEKTRVPGWNKATPGTAGF